MSEYTYKQISSKAKECYNNTKKEHRNGISSKWAYYIGEAILNPKKNVEKIKIEKPAKTSGKHINVTVKREDYLKLIKDVNKKIRETGQLKESVKIAGVKVKPKMYTAMVSYILYKYNRDAKLPSSQKVNSNIYKETVECKSPYVSHPHFLNQGAGYLGQITPSSCGPHSLRQALKKFGIDVSESTLASVAGTVEGSGTDHQGINTAIAWVAKKFGVKLNVQWVNFSDLGKTVAERFKRFGEIICNKSKAVITHIGYQCSGECSEGTIFGHYEYIDRVNTDTGYVRALNSLGSRDGRGYYGHLQDRKFSLEAHYISQISQKGLCIITKA